MNKVLVNIRDASSLIETYDIDISDMQPVVIQARSAVSYEFIDSHANVAPDHIISKRVNDDLHIFLDEENIDFEQPDIIISNFYLHPECYLIGQAENGNYYYYIPDTGEQYDLLTRHLLNRNLKSHNSLV